MRFALVLFAAALLAACGRAPPPSVLLVTVDTLRADHTSAFGYDLPTTPALDSLAARGAAFTRCVCQHPETGPSLASVMTSRYPREIGVRENGDVLPDDLPTLAEAFRSAGYRTKAYVSTYLLKPHACGLDRGFDVYDHEMTSANLGHELFERRADRTLGRVLEEGVSQEEPYFLWVHLYDPHGVYDPGPGLARRFFRGRRRPPLDPSRILPYQRFGGTLDPDDYVARYDGEIHLADRAMGRLLDAVGEETIVAFAADHGEGLGEHDYWFRHGSLLDEPALRVPLVFAGPGVPRRVSFDRLVRNLDVAPTLLALAGLEPLPGARGAPLFPLPEGAAPIAFSEARRAGGVRDRTGVDTRYKVAATTAAHRMVLWPETGESVLFDLVADPAESRDVSERQVDAADRLGAALKRWLLVGDRRAGEGPAEDVSRALESLGYIGGGK
ncbi:MAG: sulfatase [Planctomycetota bacterium]